MINSRQIVRRVCISAASLLVLACAWGAETKKLQLNDEVEPRRPATQTHEEFCRDREARQRAGDEWDKQHPGKRHKTYEQLRHEAQEATACAMNDIDRDLGEKQGSARAKPKSSDASASGAKRVHRGASAP
jgi:hypothetical protein